LPIYESGTLAGQFKRRNTEKTIWPEAKPTDTRYTLLSQKQSYRHPGSQLLTQSLRFLLFAKGTESFIQPFVNIGHMLDQFTLADIDFFRNARTWCYGKRQTSRHDPRLLSILCESRMANEKFCYERPEASVGSKSGNKQIAFDRCRTPEYSSR